MAAAQFHACAETKKLFKKIPTKFLIGIYVLEKRFIVNRAQNTP